MWPDCRLDEVMDARAGGPVADVRYVQPPVARSRRSRADKDVYGADLANHLDGVNITVQWDEGDADTDVAQAVLDTTEAAWTTLIEDGPWPNPPSTDDHLLWIILDDDIAGTGYTVEYESDDFPDGYPVVYVNPHGFGSWPDFVRSVAVHELGHAIQYGLRDLGGAADLWYWEASAEWMAELGAPELNAYALSSAYYAERPGLAFDTSIDAHDYGMFVLNASLEEDGVLLDEVWVGNDGADWVTRIEGRTGEELGATIGRMAARYTAETLRESDLYTPITIEARAAMPDAETVTIDDLGSAVYQFDDVAGFVVDGPVHVDVVVGGIVGSEVPDSGPAQVVLTRTGEGDITLGAGAIADLDTGESPTGGCGCVSGATDGVGLVVLSLAARAALRRRSPTRRSATSATAPRSPAPS